jgi:DNA replication and repair protein RecF
MSFTVEHVVYRDFRNMGAYELEPGPALTVLVGPNAAGKTNCVEGLQLLTAGTSFRKASPAELVRRGAEKGSVSLVARSEKRVLDLAYDVFPSKKLLSVNGKRRPAAEGRGILPSILFYPDELMVVKGGAAGRRELVDDFGEQLNAGYARVGHDYRRALLQRNNLLKEAVRTGVAPDEGLLEAWTESLVVAGAMLYRYRTALVARLAPLVARMYGELAGGEEAGVAYASAYAPDPAGFSADAATATGEVRAALRAALGQAGPDERRRGQTLVGPHLDDVEFSIAGMAARQFASQGQQRTLVLACKLAQVELVRQMQGSYPLFLLDDVMSELDASRRGRLFDLIQGGMQTVVTTTNVEYFRAAELDLAKVVRLGDV